MHHLEAESENSDAARMGTRLLILRLCETYNRDNHYLTNAGEAHGSGTLRRCLAQTRGKNPANMSDTVVIAGRRRLRRSAIYSGLSYGGSDVAISEEGKT